MTHIINILIILSIQLSCLYGQWEIMNEGLSGRLNSIDFVNEKVGWMSGNPGVLLKTEDGGKTWLNLYIAEDWQIEKIDFVNDSIGWAFGWKGDIAQNIIAKSVDGGQTWSIQMEVSDFAFRSIQVINDTLVFAITNDRVFKTKDGGSHWVNASPIWKDKNIMSLWFFNDTTGIVSGTYYNNGPQQGLLLKTFNGGTSWKEKLEPQLNSVDELQFINDSTGYFYGIDQNWTEYYLFETTDTCDSWSVILNHNYQIQSFTAPEVDLIFASLSDSANFTNLLKSSDGGQNWQKLLSLKNWFLPEITFATPDMGFSIGNIETFVEETITSIFRTNNQNAWEMELKSYPFQDVHFFDEQKGLAVGGFEVFHGPLSGNVLASIDSGKTWDLTYSINGKIKSCFFLDDSTGYLLISEWPTAIYKTTSGGEDWKKIYENDIILNGYEIYGTDLQFTNKQYGWMSGRYFKNDSTGAAILGTKDGGESWDLIWKYPNVASSYYFLESLFFADTSHGWAVGLEGMIIKYLGQNQWQVIDKITDLPLFDVFFLNKDTGWIFGGYYDGEIPRFILLKTTNGGETWHKNEDIEYQIKDMYFADLNKGWAVGQNAALRGMILETEDGGDHWNLSVGDLNAPLTAIDFKNGYGWAVGKSGLVLRTYDNGVNWIDENNDLVYPQKYQLKQNYPNPFNASTVISWQLAVSKHVDLKIYNILGEKVATLVSERQIAGYHKIEFNGINLPSGVYFYRIRIRDPVRRADEFHDVKKMILLR